MRAEFPNHTILAGNVVTGEMVEELILSGADIIKVGIINITIIIIIIYIIKVGIGPGSVCTTRKKTGVGYPQLSAVLECADAAHGLGGHIISDGGCTCPDGSSTPLTIGAVLEHDGVKMEQMEVRLMTDADEMALMPALSGSYIDVSYAW